MAYSKKKRGVPTMALDSARKKIDKRLSQVEYNLFNMYSRAHRELQAEWDGYMSRNKPRVEALYQKYLEAKKSGTKEEIDAALKAYQDKLSSVTYKSEHYRQNVENLTRKLSNINQEALRYINQEMPYVASTAYNQMATDIAKADIDITWSIYNEDTIHQIMKGNVKLPEKKLDIPKDKRWNKKKMDAELMQGILQGESIDEIAKRLQNVTTANRDSAIRNARTMTTRAENAGRQASYNRAHDEGIILNKIWMTAGDRRVRPTHARQDRMEIPYNETFPNGCEYPGYGPASEVWNCRCTMASVVIGFRRPDGSISYVNGRR